MDDAKIKGFIIAIPILLMFSILHCIKIIEPLSCLIPLSLAAISSPPSSFNHGGDTQLAVSSSEGLRPYPVSGLKPWALGEHCGCTPCLHSEQEQVQRAMLHIALHNAEDVWTDAELVILGLIAIWGHAFILNST